MTRLVLKGINGSNPLGFMASVGLLRLLDDQQHTARLGFAEDGSFNAWIECAPAFDIADIAAIVATDAALSAGPQPWRLEYEKAEKRGVKKVADLKPPPERFSGFLALAIDEWAKGSEERSEYAAAYATDFAVDGKGNTKPTAFHFTAANQQFLGAVDGIRNRVTEEWVDRALRLPRQVESGRNLRWDPDAERSRALMGVNPTEDGTVVNAPLEWLAFRGLPAFRCVPVGDRIMTCGVTGRRQNELRFHWPLWSCGASYATVRSLLVLAAGWIEKEERARRMIQAHGGSSKPQRSQARLHRDLESIVDDRRLRGVFAICTAGIRRTAQGFGNFGPAYVRA